MDFWTFYINGLYEFVLFILYIFIFLSYVIIIVGGIALAIGIPAGLFFGIYELYRYCVNRSNNSNTDSDSVHSSDEVNIELPHVTQNMLVESSLQQSGNRIKSTNYEQI